MSSTLIESYMKALQMANAFSEARIMYENLVLISEEEHVNEKARYEAKELTKNGFHEYVKYLSSLGGADEDEE